MSAPNQNVIPSILETNARNENQSTRVESVILDANNHSWVKGQFGKTIFNLPKKGTALSSDACLIWRTKWDNTSAVPSTSNSASFPRLTGAPVVLDTARLFIGGKLVSETREVGQKIVLDNHFLPYDAQAEVNDVKLNCNHDFGYDTDGQVQLGDGEGYGKKGTQTLSVSLTNGLESSVRLKDLFPMLKDMMIPMVLKGDVLVEINWKGQWADCIVENSAGGIPADSKYFEVERPRLHLDYVSYADDIANAFNDEVLRGQGQKIAYREAVLVQNTLDALSGVGASNTQDVELGFMNRSVMKLYLQKRLNGVSNACNRSSRSDGLTGETHQLIVNNRQMYSRTVKNVSEMYGYLNQTGDVPFCSLDGTFDRIGANPTAENNTFALSENNGGLALNSVRNDYQGRFRWVGFNLAKSRRGNDTPSNAVNVGEAPMVLRVGRSGTGKQGEPTTDYDKSCDLNIWVECVKMADISNGDIEVFGI